MSRDPLVDASPAPTESSFALPPARRRVGAPERGAQDPVRRLLTMVAIGFLLASPVVTLLVALP